MNLARLRELLKAWQSGAIRDAELAEIRDALPEVLDAINNVLTTAEAFDSLANKSRMIGPGYRDALLHCAEQIRRAVCP